MLKYVKIGMLATSVALVLGIFLGVNSGGVHAANQQDSGAYKQMDVYGEVLRHIQSDYVVDPKIDQVTNGALRGLAESLDPDSSYLTAAEYKSFKADKGGKAQVGLNVSKRYGYAMVVSVVPGSPADKADINDGDIIEAIGTQDTRDISLAMIQLMLQGAPGSEVTLAVIRPRRAEPEKIVLSRVVVSQPPVAEAMYENSSILYLRPMVVDHEHVQQVESKLRARPHSNGKVLLDLRDVAAGDMGEAIRLANFFLKTGTIAILEGQKVAKQTFTADASKAIDASSPLVVLINRGTSGPGELVAAALNDNKRADLVGEKTFGEGAQQKTFELADGSALILSIAKYEAPSGKKLQDDAVTPGTLVASTSEEPVVDEEAAGVSGAKSVKPATVKRAAPQADDQLNKALELLKAKAA